MLSTTPTGAGAPARTASTNACSSMRYAFAYRSAKNGTCSAALDRDERLGRILDRQHPRRPEDLDALVVAVRREPAVLDHTQYAAGKPHARERGVPVAVPFEHRMDEAARTRVHLFDLPVQKEARHVEIVDRHVHEDAAGLRNERLRRQSRIAAHDPNRLRRANPPGGDVALKRRERGIEAALKRDHEGHLPALDLGLNLPRRLGSTKIQRLLAEDRQAPRERRP